MIGSAAPDAAIAPRSSLTSGLRRARQQDMRNAAAWTGSELCPLGLPSSEMMERLLGWFVDHRIAGPDEESLASLIVTARRTFEDNVLERIASFLSSEHRRKLDASLADEDGGHEFLGPSKPTPANPISTTSSSLRGDLPS